MRFEKNKKLDEVLIELNDLLEQAEIKLLEKSSANPSILPNMVLIGCPRAGSTLFTQWAASLEIFSYPSNFLSRFFKAPGIGALIYQILTKPDYQYNNEFSDINHKLDFKSSIGKTQGLKSPHEFWYFWRQFHSFPSVPISENRFAAEFDFQTFYKEINLLQSIFDKPFFIKGKIINPYISCFSQNDSRLLFIHLYRDLLATARSLLVAREKWNGNTEAWFSWKPREYDLIKNMDVYHQVAGQVYFIEKEILSKKEGLGDNYIPVSYESFCQAPKKIYDQFVEKINQLDPSYKAPDYTGEDSFQISGRKSEVDNKLLDALNFFSDKYGALNY